jgi:hypothetical protein
MKQILISLVMTLSSLAWAASAPNVDQILQNSDRSRGGLKSGVQWQAVLKSMEDGDESSREFQVKAKGNNALVEISSPARNQGEKFLFLDRNMWFSRPSLRKPVSISSRQRMSGQAANGDIATTQYARDYSAKLVRKEAVGGQMAYVLDLKSKDEKTTYDRITYWVTEKDNLGIKAEFLNMQGHVMKRATIEYKNQIQLEGKSVPFISSVRIEDAFNAKNYSVMTYTRPEATAVPANLFDVNNLAR